METPKRISATAKRLGICRMDRVSLVFFFDFRSIFRLELSQTVGVCCGFFFVGKEEEKWEGTDQFVEFLAAAVVEVAAEFLPHFAVVDEAVQLFVGAHALGVRRQTQIL